MSFISKVASWSCRQLLVTMICLPALQNSEAQISREEDLKAALLISFARFTSWPSSLPVDSPIVIGIVNQPELLSSLIRLSFGKVANGHPIQARGVRYASDLKQCHLVDFGSLAGKKLNELLGPAHGLPLLTVGASERFLQSGGAIQIFLDDGRLNFSVRMSALEQSGLSVSSKLLRLGVPSRDGQSESRSRSSHL